MGPLEISTNRQNRNPRKPPAGPGHSAHCRPLHAYLKMQRLQLTLQYPTACPGLATHTLAGLCALWFPSAASSSGNLHEPAKPQPPPQTITFPALLQPPVQAPLEIFTKALQCPMACPGLDIHTLAGLCVLWLLSAASSSTKSPLTDKIAPPTNHLHSTPAAAPSAGRFTTAAHCSGCI